MPNGSDNGADTSMSGQDTQPGGYRGKQVKSRGTEGNSDHASAIDHAEHAGIGPGSDRKKHVGDTNLPC